MKVSVVLRKTKEGIEPEMIFSSLKTANEYVHMRNIYKDSDSESEFYVKEFKIHKTMPSDLTNKYLYAKMSGFIDLSNQNCYYNPDIKPIMSESTYTHQFNSNNESSAIIATLYIPLSEGMFNNFYDYVNQYEYIWQDLKYKVIQLSMAGRTSYDIVTILNMTYQYPTLESY